MWQTILIDNLLIRIINSQYPILSQKLNRKCDTIEYTNHDKIQGLRQSNTSYLFWLLSIHGRHVSTSSRSSSGPNLRIQVLH